MTPSDDAALADLADAVLTLARELEFRHDGAGIIELTVNERLVLRALDQEEEMAPSALADRLGLQRSNLSTALRGLEAKGLIVRTAGKADGRGVAVSSTSRAAQNLERLRARWAEVLAATGRDGEDVRPMASRLREMGAELVERRRHVA